MGLTRRGALVLAAAPLLAVVAWLFALPEAAVLAVATAAAVLTASVWVLIRRPDLEIQRRARPPRCTVGDNCQVELQSRNRSRRRSSVVLLRDDVGRHGTAQLRLGPLGPGASATAVYALPADRRGLHRVGPLSVTIEDPFALARATHTDESFVTVIVLPRTWALAPLRGAPGDEPEQGLRAITSLSTVDEEFSALRAYVPGDDIRRIHWRSTARTGSPVVRQFDLPWQHRTTVVVDQCTRSDDHASFERTVSVAASLVESAASRGELVRLVASGSDDPDVGFVSARDHLDELMDRLATLVPTSSASVDPSTGDTVHDGADRLGRMVRSLAAGATGRLVVCSDVTRGGEVVELSQAATRFGVRIVVTTSATPPGSAVRSASSSAAHGAPLQVIHWNGSEPLDRVWDRAVGRIPAGSAGPVGFDVAGSSR